MKSSINIAGKAVSLPQVTKSWLIFIEILIIAGWWLPGASEAYGQIALRGFVTNGNTTGGTLTIDKPADLGVGDIMFANIALYGADIALNNPSSIGWTLIDGNDVGGSEERRSALLYRLATATDAGPEVTNYSFTLSTSDDYITAAVGTICAFSGVDTAGGVLAWGGAGGPFDVIPGESTVAFNITVVDASITTITNNAAVIMFGQSVGTTTGLTWSGWTAISPAIAEIEGSDQQNGGTSVGAAWAIKSTAGATGIASAILTASEQNSGILIALRPLLLPTFAVVDPICLGETLSPLPTTSIEGITGTWAPALDNTATTRYTFTPDVGQFATTTTMEIVVDIQESPSTGTITQPTCIIPTGSVVLSGLPATGIWTINPGGFTGQGENVTISGLSTGSYNFTVTNEAGCISPASASVVIDAISGSPSAPVVTLTQPTCTVATGTISVTVQNAGETYSFDNGASFQAGNSRPGMSTGTYIVIIRSSSGCNSTGTTATINPPVSTPESPVQSFDCTPGVGNATVTVTSPAGADLEYSLDGGTYQTGMVFTGIANGSHTITVRNSSSGCTATGTSFTVSCGCPDAPTLVLSRVSGGTCGITPITVSGNTFINATNITLTVNGAGTFSTTDPNTSPFAFTYTPAAGDAGNTVLITVTTDNPSGSPCAAASATYTLNVNTLPAAPTSGVITQPVTCDAASGRVELNGLPAMGTWTINPGAMSGTGASTTISGLAGGTYNFTATNEAGCISAASGDIVINSAPAAPEAPSVSVTDPTCSVTTGIITVTSSTSGLTFSLDGAPFTAYPTEGYTLIAAGPHTLTAQNASNCISSVTDITVKSLPSIKDNYTEELSDFNGFNISCYGNSDGFIRINSSGAATPFAFSWNGHGGFTASTEDISGLTAGEYTVLITDINLCTARDTFMLTEPTGLSMTFDLSISTDGAYNISCAGEITGTINVSVPDYVGLVTYLWSDGQSGSQRTDLPAGTYDIIITDQNNCMLDSNVVLTEPDPIKPAFDITQPSCPDNADGEIRLTVSGGVQGSDYNYLWSDNSTNRDLSNIPAGSYEVTISDANGCSSRSSINLEASQETCLVMNEALSPNGDLINDVWNISNKSSYPDMEVTIYNRWGQSVWKSGRGYPVPWDGKSNGADLPVDSYHYVIDLNTGSKPIVGDITIVR